jgi:hypothetical protein
MKKCVLLLLLVISQCSFGQTDTNVIAIGDWSANVSDKDGYTLRGRLLVYDSEGLNKWGYWTDGRVYLELQHVRRDVGDLPIEIYINDMDELHFQMQDAFGNPIKSEMLNID